MPDLPTLRQKRQRGPNLASARFKVELDLHLVYEPPMHENDVGIVITREFEMPFAPTSGLMVYSREWEECPEPQGMLLKEVVWDVDREVFLASSHCCSVDFPIAGIPFEIRCWLDKGWDWGSYLDRYQRDDTSKAPRRPKPRQPEDSTENSDSHWDERLHRLPRSERPTVFNRFFQSLIRHMASTYSSLETAYAMDKTQRYLGPQRDWERDQDSRKLWDDAHDEYKRMSGDERWKWMRRVEKKYPRLESVVLGNRSARS